MKTTNYLILITRNVTTIYYNRLFDFLKKYNLDDLIDFKRILGSHLSNQLYEQHEGEYEHFEQIDQL